ncbi:MAG: polyamine aminopropyltransferase [Candidatus Aminicenantes bacterium]|nr:MAG: polyamine aminopropyltransferase [Candidatus Aminicenantes bacterium]
MTKEGFYFEETFTEDLIRNIKVEKILFEGKTKYQYVQIFENKMLGKMLFLDKKIQSAAIDESIFHESLVHPALMTHHNPQNVLIIGGGEGATLREVLRHNCVKSATMVDIDKQLVRLCQEHLPEWSSGAFSDLRAKVVFGDALKYVEKCSKKFDVVISDLTEPIEKGPSVYLFTEEFYRKVSQILKDDGVFVLQAGSTDISYNQFFSSCSQTLEQVFPVVRPYWTFMFSFYSPWGFIMASWKQDPLDKDEKMIKSRIKDRKIKKLVYYHPGIHRGLFALPLYLELALKKGDILTDKKPFIWEL